MTYQPNEERDTMSDKIEPAATEALAEAAIALAVGPDDRIVVSLPGADLATLHEVSRAFAEKGFDMDRVLILGGDGIQIGVMRSSVVMTHSPTRARPSYPSGNGKRSSQRRWIPPRGWPLARQRCLRHTVMRSTRPSRTNAWPSP